MANLTNAGLNLLRDALNGVAGNKPVITYVAIGTGLCRLTAQLASGTAYTSLSTTALSTAKLNGESITIANGTQTQAVTLSANAAAGATSIAVTSFTANATYPINSTITNTPANGDTALQVESFRKAVTSSANGAAAGESLITLQLGPQDANPTYIAEIGWFAGNATATLNSGTLMGRVAYGHYHDNTENINLVFDVTL